MWLSFLLKLSFWRGRKILYLDCDVRYIRSWWFQWQLLTQRKEGMLLQRPLKAECRVVSFIAKPKFLLLYWNSDLRLLRFFFFFETTKKTFARGSWNEKDLKVGGVRKTASRFGFLNRYRVKVTREKWCIFVVKGNKAIWTTEVFFVVVESQ